MQVTSDATPAYRLVNDKVERIDRSLFYVKPDLLVILDRLDLVDGTKAALSARFQIFNEDTRGIGAVTGTTFTIKRPHAGLVARTHAYGSTPVTALRALDLPPEEGSFPFIEVTSGAAAQHTLLTVVAAHPTGGEPGQLDVRETAQGWTIRGSHSGQNIAIDIDRARAALPFSSV